MASGSSSRYVVEGDRNKDLNPSTITDGYWVYIDNPSRLGRTYGKWLVFGKLKLELDQLWHKIHPLVSSGQLGATRAKCSTARPNPTTNDHSRGVICVYTTQQMRDEVGQRLQSVVKKTIMYKSDEATLAGRYVSQGHKRVCEKTLHWKH